MNKFFTILCMASILVSHTSCNDSVMNYGSPSVEAQTRVVDQRVQDLIQQARQGDVEACNSLALCYRDGDGIGQSWLNMICMYAIYSQKTGGDIEDIISLFEEGHPFRLLTEILDSPSFNEKVEIKLEQLKQLAPAEAKAIEAVKNAYTVEEAADAMKTIRDAEEEGSELAAVFQIIYYDEVEDVTRLEDCLIRITEKYPYFNQLLGDLYAEQYEDSEDFSYIQKAIEYYYKADAYGMLTPKCANTLWRMHNNFGKEGLLEYDEQEMERLKILAKRIY